METFLVEIRNVELLDNPSGRDRSVRAGDRHTDVTLRVTVRSSVGGDA